MRRYANIKQCNKEDIDPDRPRDEQKYCLYAKSSGKLLGRHSTIEEAQEQEAAIHARGGATTMNDMELGQAELDALADRLEEIIDDANEYLAQTKLPETIDRIYIDPRIGGGLVDLGWQQEPSEGAYASADAQVHYVDPRDGKYLSEHFDVDLQGEVAGNHGIVSLTVGPTTLVDSYEFDQYDLEHYRDLAEFFANALPTEEGEPVGHALVRSVIDSFQREMRTGTTVKTSKYLRLAEVPESAVKSLYQDEWGQNLMKAIGDEVNIDSQAAQFLFFTAWNGVIQLMDKMLQEKQDVDTTEYSQDPTFMQALAGIAYFVADDALKTSLGVKSDSISKAKGHVETLMQLLGKEAPVDKTLEGLKAQAKPIAEKAFDALMDWLKQQPAKEQKAAHVAEVKDPIKARIALVKTAFTKVAAEGWGIFWMPQAGKGGAWLVGKDDGSGNIQILSSESDLSSDELIEMAAKKVPGLDKGSTKVYPKTANVRLGSVLDVEAAIRPYIENSLEKYEPWVDEGGYSKREFKRLVNAWIEDISSYVFWAEESGTGDVTGLDYNDYAQQLAGLLFKVAPDWELEATDKGKMDIYYDLKDVEDAAVDMGFEAAAKSLQNPTFAHVDTKIRKWARRQDGNTGHRSLWLQDVVAVDAQPEAWVDAAEQAGLYVPASMQRQAYVHEYIQEEMNDALATELKEKSQFGKVGKFTFGEGTDHHKGQWGLWFVTPAVEDVTALVAAPPKEKEKMHKKASKKTASKAAPKFIRFAGHTYRKAEAEDSRDRDAGKVRSAESGFWVYLPLDRGRIEGPIMGAGSTPDEAERDLMDMLDRDPKPESLGDYGDRYDYNMEYVLVRATPALYQEVMEHGGDVNYVITGPDRNPIVALECEDSRDRDAGKVSDEIVDFFKGLKKASARTKWARTAKRKRTCCGPRSRKSESKVELPTDCIEQLVGARYSDSDTTTFEKKDDKWFVEGVDSQGVIDDMFVQMAQSTCEMATTASKRRAAVDYYLNGDVYAYGYFDDDGDTYEVRLEPNGNFDVVQKHLGGTNEAVGEGTYKSSGDLDVSYGPYEDDFWYKVEMILHDLELELSDFAENATTAATKRTADQEMLPGLYEEVIEVDPSWSSMGKFDHYVDDEVIYEIISNGFSDESLGDADSFGAYDLVLFLDKVLVKEPDGSTWSFEAAIAFTNSQGFVDVKYYDSTEEARRDWAMLEDEYEDFLGEIDEDYF